MPVGRGSFSLAAARRCVQSQEEAGADHVELLQRACIRACASGRLAASAPARRTGAPACNGRSAAPPKRPSCLLQAHHTRSRSGWVLCGTTYRSSALAELRFVQTKRAAQTIPHPAPIPAEAVSTPSHRRSCLLQPAPSKPGSTGTAQKRNRIAADLYGRCSGL